MSACLLYDHPKIPWTFDSHDEEHTYFYPFLFPPKWRCDHTNLFRSFSSHDLYPNLDYHTVYGSLHDKSPP